MPNDVLLVQLNDSQSRDAAQPVYGIHQPAFERWRQIDLRDVSRDDDFGTHAHSRQKHFHLGSRCILPLIENDASIVQRSPAHISERGDLDDLGFHVLLDLLEFEQIVERVQQRAKVRVDLRDQIAGQEAEPFAGFHSRAYQHNLLDCPLSQECDGHAHGKKRLASSRWSNTDGDIVLTQSLDISALTVGSRTEILPAFAHNPKPIRAPDGTFLVFHIGCGNNESDPITNCTRGVTPVMEAAEDNKVIKLLNLVLLQAIKDRASDIHFEPFEDEFKMRYRIDGVLYEMAPPPKELGPAITSRVKVMAKMDIAERRLPQDGRIELTVGGAPVDLRISVLPTMHGESVVMRVLDRSNVQLAIDRIGMREDDLETFKRLINKPNGVVVVTGPTGSGKTTTLYAALASLNDIETKILTAEDPVEYDIDGLCQVQVNRDVDLTFARALRSFLRQDPDVILVGEIRDLETAEIAIQASLTGHLVLTTLHTNDAPSSVIRLVDLGVEPFLLTATMEGVVAQRLCRTICVKCKEQFTPTEEQLMELQLRSETMPPGSRFFRGKGCDNCYKSGYRGRMAVFEIMGMNDEMRDLVMKKASTNILRAASRKYGMRTLRECGLLAINEAQTTLDEVVRETIAEED